MGNYCGPALPTLSSEEEEAVLGLNTSINGIVAYIEERKPKNIVLMVGAGISVSAGIPDFRTEGSGLYANLQKYNLPKPESMFEIDYFMSDPRPFYDLAKDLLPSNFCPTPTHFFIKLLQDKGMLKRCYSQNIDTLERLAGVDPDLLIEAHGSFGSSHCMACGMHHTMEYFRNKIVNMTDKVVDESISSSAAEAAREGEESGAAPSPKYIPWCKCSKEGCEGNVKPDIVFFGEGLPGRFFESRDADLADADLLIVLGTSLAVAPFCNTMHLCNPHAPRLLINLERVGMPNWMSGGHGFKFDMRGNYRDVELLATCDDGVRVLCDLLGWRAELESLIESYASQCSGTGASTAGINASTDASCTAKGDESASEAAAVSSYQPIPIDPKVLSRVQRIAADAPLTADELREQEIEAAQQTGDEDYDTEAEATKMIAAIQKLNAAEGSADPTDAAVTFTSTTDTAGHE